MCAYQLSTDPFRGLGGLHVLEGICTGQEEDKELTFTHGVMTHTHAGKTTTPNAASSGYTARIIRNAAFRSETKKTSSQGMVSKGVPQTLITATYGILNNPVTTNSTPWS